jgi:MraZ protein
MFRGVNNINLDAKGRLAIPTRFRDILSEHCNDHLVITIDTDERCLLVYPLPRWEDIQRKVESLSSFNPASRRVQRLLIGHATDVHLDSNGRVLLPLPLREYARLDKKVVMIGQGHKLELWSEEHWKERREAWIEDQSLTESSSELQNLSL